MTPELGLALIGLISAATALLKAHTTQLNNKKQSDSLEAEVRVLRERVNRLDKFEEKFDKVNETLVEVKTQLAMLLAASGMKPKAT